MSLQAVQIANAISQLSIAGLTIKTLATIPSIGKIAVRELPIMVPDVRFITNQNAVSQNVSKGSDNFFGVNRQLNYTVLFAEVGMGRGIFEYVEDMVALFDQITTAILSLDIEDVDIQDVLETGFGVVSDGEAPNAKKYFGFSIGVIVTEFVNS